MVEKSDRRTKERLRVCLRAGWRCTSKRKIKKKKKERKRETEIQTEETCWERSTLKPVRGFLPSQRIPSVRYQQTFNLWLILARTGSLHRDPPLRLHSLAFTPHKNTVIPTTPHPLRRAVDTTHQLGATDRVSSSNPFAFTKHTLFRECFAYQKLQQHQ